MSPVELMVRVLVVAAVMVARMPSWVAWPPTVVSPTSPAAVMLMAPVLVEATMP